jgi:hypothetical protein
MPSPSSWGPFMWSLLHDVSNKVDLINDQYICGSNELAAELKKLTSSANASGGANAKNSANVMIEMQRLGEISALLQSRSREMSDALKSLLDSLKFVLPCYNCRMHFTEFIMSQKESFFNQLVATCNSKESITKTIVDLHNTVNHRLGKPITKMSLYDFVDKAEAKKGRWKQNKKYHNQLTLPKLDFLLKAIRSDDICNPSSTAAHEQRQEIITKYFYSKADNTCIALEQFDRFLDALETLYSMFVNLDPFTTIAGKGAYRMGLNTLILNHIHNFRLEQQRSQI